MKHSNPAMRKPSLGKINFDLSSTKLNTKDEHWYIFTCPVCGTDGKFKLKDIPSRVVKCSCCGWEEVFFKSNYVWETYEQQSEKAKTKLKELFEQN